MADELRFSGDIDSDRDQWDKEIDDIDFATERLNAIPEGELDFFFDVEEAMSEAIDVLIKKHKDYGPHNISDSPGGPLVGLSVRLHDKVARLANLIGRENEINYEPLHDTFLDITNYGIIGMLVVDGKWPTERKEL